MLKWYESNIKDNPIKSLEFSKKNSWLKHQTVNLQQEDPQLFKCIQS